MSFHRFTFLGLRALLGIASETLVDILFGLFGSERPLRPQQGHPFR